MLFRRSSCFLITLKTNLAFSVSLKYLGYITQSGA